MARDLLANDVASHASEGHAVLGVNKLVIPLGWHPEGVALGDVLDSKLKRVFQV